MANRVGSSPRGFPKGAATQKILGYPRGVGVPPELPPFEGYTAWYDFSQEDSVLLSGTTVQRIFDKSENDHDLFTLTGTLVMDGTRMMNGVVVPDWSSDGMVAFFDMVVPPYAWMFVISVDSIGNQNLFNYVGGGEYMMRMTNPPSMVRVGTSGVALSGVNLPTDSPMVFGATREVGSGTMWFMFGDNWQGINVSGQATPTTGAATRIGTRISSEHYDGIWGECLYYPESFSRHEMTKLANYFRRKWGAH